MSPSNTAIAGRLLDGLSGRIQLQSPRPTPTRRPTPMTTDLQASLQDIPMSTSARCWRWCWRPDALQLIDDTDGAHDAGPAELAAGTIAATDTALARAALAYLLATDPAAARLLPRAMQIATEPDTGPALFDPLALLASRLIFAVLQTEVDWTSTDSSRWKLRIRKRAMRDSTTLIRGLLQPNEPATGAP
jgi:hypothetical protein